MGHGLNNLAIVTLFRLLSFVHNTTIDKRVVHLCGVALCPPPFTSRGESRAFDWMRQVEILH